MNATIFRALKFTIGLSIALLAVTTIGAVALRVPFDAAVTQTPRFLATTALSRIYRADLDQVSRTVATYYRGRAERRLNDPASTWSDFERDTQGRLRIATVRATPLPDEVPFVYESPDARHVATMRETFGLGEMLSEAPSEYDALLSLAGWVGRQFDHGDESAMLRERYACNPTGAVLDGRQGQRLWCELAARTMVSAATAVGVPARLITLSRDGYTWEHAVVELWSNQHDKWFAIDTDYNLVYERAGIPLGSVELATAHGDASFQGDVRIRPIAPKKPHIPNAPESTLGLYRYINLDMRTDWCSRTLRRGSPAGGDAATWWVAPEHEGVLLTSRQRVTPVQMGWKVNHVAILPRAMSDGNSTVTLDLDVVGYAPTFRAFQLRLDDGPWREMPADGGAHLDLAPGRHRIEARIVNHSPFPGPSASVELALEARP